MANVKEAASSGRGAYANHTLRRYLPDAKRRPVEPEHQIGVWDRNAIVCSQNALRHSVVRKRKKTVARTRTAHTHGTPLDRNKEGA